MKVIWKKGDLIFVIWKGRSSNKKISNGLPLVQTFTFSLQQWEYANSGKSGMYAFFALDGPNCKDCPFSRNNGGKGGCYTHKAIQYSGFLGMLRSITKEQLTGMSGKKRAEIINMCAGTYVRFGTYGEPSLIPIELVRAMAEVSSSWTGYTHQWEKRWAQPYKDFFMASRHEAGNGEKGWRSFEAIGDLSLSSSVNCPASNEAGFKSNCAKCGLCSGLLGKGKKSVKILIH